jgi:hypothetical protein
MINLRARCSIFHPAGSDGIVAAGARQVTHRASTAISGQSDVTEQKHLEHLCAQEAVELSLHVPGDDKAKAPVSRPPPASAQFRNGRPVGAPPAPRDPPVWPEAPQQDPRRAPVAPARETLMQRLAQRPSQPSQPSTVTAIGICAYETFCRWQES